MLVAHLIRKPLSEGTVAANVIKHRTGAINIDICRTGYTSEADLEQTKMKNPGRGREKVTSQVYGAGRPQQTINTSGRWPANVLLQHTEECLFLGLVEGEAYTINRWSDGAKPFGGGAGHPYEGTQVDAVFDSVWSCTSECPVPHLDSQATPVNTGASRFYKQFGGSCE